MANASEIASAHNPAAPLDPAWCWAAYQPDAKRPWNPVRAGHLLRRAGFGPEPASLRQALADGPQTTVDKLLRPGAGAAEFNRRGDNYESAAGDVPALRAWWLRRMIDTPQPLLEKVTLFWHSHFGLSNDRVGDPAAMGRHVRLLRAHALGSYAEMLRALLADPALWLGVQAAANRKAQPSPLLARAMLEDYVLEAGRFQEKDVAEAARALTGWFVLRGRLRYVEREHDPDEKVLCGERGPWKAEDVVKILLRQPAAPRSLARRLCRLLISECEDLPDEVLAPLAASLARDWNVGRAVETILRSNLMFSPAAYRQRVKSPVELAVGLIRGLEGTAITTRLGDDLAALGQGLYRPPTLHGWSGGSDWINAFTLRARTNLAAALLCGAEPYGDKLDPWALARRHGHATPEAAAAFLDDLLLQGDLPEAARPLLREGLPGPGRPDGEVSRWLRGYVQAMVSLPEYQLC